VTMASPQSGPDVLTSGPDDAGPLSGRKALLLAALLALIAGVVVWRLLPGQPPIFTLADLEGVYAGMVRSDGTNDASVIDLDRVVEEPGDVVPNACEPLFEATVLNRAPHDALDGVSTYWALDRAAVSLFTYRFLDTATADREYARLTRAFDACRDVRVEVHARSAAASTLSGTKVDRAGEVPAQLGYVVTADDGTKLAVHVLAFSNTVSWQFRYEPVRGTYTPLAAQRVMDSLADQMRAVQDLHRSA
jgi:hypothetical protein